MDPVIRKTEERLEWLSSDEETLRLYEARENSRIEWNSSMYSAREEGKAEGKAELIRSMLQKGLTVSQIADFTGLTVEEVKVIEP